MRYLGYPVHQELSRSDNMAMNGAMPRGRHYLVHLGPYRASLTRCTLSSGGGVTHHSSPNDRFGMIPSATGELTSHFSSTGGQFGSDVSCAPTLVSGVTRYPPKSTSKTPPVSVLTQGLECMIHTTHGALPGSVVLIMPHAPGMGARWSLIFWSPPYMEPDGV